MAKKQEFEGIVSKLGLQPLESQMMIGVRKSKQFIGIPKERSFQEHQNRFNPRKCTNAYR
jgi:hypothetical protein